MPIYEYKCPSCNQRFEVMRRIADPPLETCTSCGGGPVEKLVSAPAFQFKGSGWYVTDYARKDGERKEGGKKDRADGEDGTKSTTAKSGSSDTKSGDAKSSESKSSASKSDNKKVDSKTSDG